MRCDCRLRTPWAFRFWYGVAGATLVLGLLIPYAYAATFVVDDTGDAGDANPGDGFAVTGGGVTTLRAAVEETNALAGKDSIEFDSAAFSDPVTLLLGSTLSFTDDVVVVGPGPALLTLSGGDSVRVLRFSGTAEVSDLAISHGYDSLEGGGVRVDSGADVTLRRCEVSYNQADYVGAGIAAYEALTLIDCLVRSNETSMFGAFGGGGLGGEDATFVIEGCRFEDNYSASVGGAVYCLTGVVLCQDTAFVNNATVNQGGGVHLVECDEFTFQNCLFAENTSVGRGGGLGVDAAVSGLFVNCTFSGNEAGTNGGGLRIHGEDLLMMNCTVTGNSADTSPPGTYDGGGIYWLAQDDGQFRLGNTVVAGNTTGGGATPDVSGDFTSLGHNLIGALDEGATGIDADGDQTGTIASPIDPMLDSLEDNGGPTATHMPLEASPLLDAGDNTLVTNPPFDGPPFRDQRGVGSVRIYNGIVDIGAVENVPFDDVPPEITLTGAATVEQECGDSFTDPGATASDSNDGAITEDIVVSGAVDTAVPDEYVLSYDVTDAAGNTAPTVTRTVHIIDTVAPVITLLGTATVTVECSTVYSDPGTMVSDACDTALTTATVDTSGLEMNTAGEYTVTYTATDASGNAANPVTRIVIVEGPCAHTADQDGDSEISLSELLRVIQFFNSDGLHCEEGTEDGYAPGPGDTASRPPHACDYNPTDWEVDLSELLRLIQFFNSAGYHACPDADPPTEDGYCVGLFDR